MSDTTRRAADFEKELEEMTTAQLRTYYIQENVNQHIISVEKQIGGKSRQYFESYFTKKIPESLLENEFVKKALLKIDQRQRRGTDIKRNEDLARRCELKYLCQFCFVVKFQKANQQTSENAKKQSRGQLESFYKDNELKKIRDPEARYADTRYPHEIFERPETRVGAESYGASEGARSLQNTGTTREIEGLKLKLQEKDNSVRQMQERAHGLETEIKKLKSNLKHQSQSYRAETIAPPSIQDPAAQAILHEAVQETRDRSALKAKEETIKKLEQDLRTERQKYEKLYAEYQKKFADERYAPEGESAKTSEIKTLKEENQVLEKAVIVLQKKLEEQISKTESKMEEVIRLQGQLKEVKVQLQEVRSTSTRIQSQKESIQRGERDKDQQLSKLQEELDTEKREKLRIQREKGAVEGTLADIQIQIKEYVTKLSTAEEKIKEGNTKIQRLTTTNEGLQTSAENDSKEKDKTIGQLKAEGRRNKEQFELQTKKNKEEFEADMRKQKLQFQAETRRNKEKYESEKGELESSISTIAVEKQNLEVEIRKLKNNADSIQEEMRGKDSKIEELEEKVMSLEDEILGKKRRKRAIVTAKSTGDFKEADVVFLEKLEAKLKENGVKYSLLPLEDATEGAAYSHVIFMGHHINSLQSDYDKNLGNRIEADKKGVVIFHHSPKHKSKITPSRGTLPKDVTDHIQPNIITDCVYWSKDGFYDCPTNDTALKEITEFLQEH